MIKFAHISPYLYMELAHKHSEVNLVLAHLIGDNEYTRFYAQSPKPTIMDNSAFELGASFEPEKLLELGKMVKADYIVLPDYPGQDSQKTIDAAKKYIPIFKEAGFKCFYAPQASKGDLDGLLRSWEWAANNPNIDLIGHSILAAPLAYNNTVKVGARYEILKLLEEQEWSSKLKKRIHMLGMLDTVREIHLCQPFEKFIYSWDSSAAAWAGCNLEDVYDRSTKFDLPVDFDFHAPTLFTEGVVQDNFDYINYLCKENRGNSLF